MSSILLVSNSERNIKSKRFRSCKRQDLSLSPPKKVKKQIGKVIKYYNYFYNEKNIACRLFYRFNGK